MIMKTILAWTLAAVVALGGSARAQATTKRSARSPLVGAWHLVSLDEPEPDGKLRHITDAKGSLIYTEDGFVSVQVMYAKAETSTSTAPVQYAQGGYEASFGRYVVNGAAHTVTHRYEGSLVRWLLGKDFPRTYELSGRRLTIRSPRADEPWFVVWERY